MISIFREIVSEYKINLDIDSEINSYYKKYLKDKKKYNKIQDFYEYIYEEYSTIQNIEPNISLIEESQLFKNDIFEFNKYNFDLNIQTFCQKSCLLESLKMIIESENKNKYFLDKCKKYTKKFKYYPEINDYKNYDTFLRELSFRKEFGIHYIPNYNNSCKRGIFELSPHQLFLKNLLSNNTPYNGILIFHGVGVGKTCSGVSVAENFKDSENKIIILAPEKIQSGWKNTIYDPYKEDNQCTANEYNYEEDKYEKNKERLKEKKIKEFYEMKGYLSFANSVKNYIEENTKHISQNNILERKKREIELIKEKYSNKVLIIDEVHNIRSEESIIKSRDTILFIEKVIKYSDNLKLILLTANPMFNQPEEIVWILNMLLMNDNRKTIHEEIKFNENNELTEESIELINENSKGYVSYLRGENPITFPYRLYPINRDRILKTDKLDIFGNKVKNNEKLSFLELYSSKLEGKQRKIYELETKNLENTETIDQVTYYGKLLQISNCIYPHNSDNIEDLYGSSGLNNCFTVKTKKPVKYSYKKNILNFLDLDQLSKYSCKIKSIIDSIDKSDGIIFIYSNFLDGGIMPLVLALEQNGYMKYDKEEVLISDKKRKLKSYKGGNYNSENEEDYPATYSVIAGDSLKLTNDFEKELSIATSSDNNDGKIIKIIIGSTVAAEGLDFKNIRCIHLMEPWHNINKLEQVIGRGIRNCSHSELEEEFRNVTIYLHTCELEKKETIETYLYRRCEHKAKQIGQIEIILKDTAIDKYLFQNANLIKEEDIEQIKINPSLRSSNDNSFYEKPYDKPFSRTCSFLNTKKLNNNISCDYLDNSNVEINKQVIKNMNDKTFTIKNSQPIIDTYKKYISDIILEYYVLTLKELETIMKAKISNFIVDIFNHSLNQMIMDKYTIELSDIKGYIKYIDDYYLFQPINNDNIFLSLYYRLNNGIIDKNDYRLELDNYLPDIPEIKEYTWTEIESKYDEIIGDKKLEDITKGDYSQVEIIFNLKNERNLIFDNKIKYSYIIDRLRFSEKRLLLYSIFEYKKENYKLKEEYSDFMKDLITLLSPLFIYHNEDTGKYEWFKEFNEKNLNKLYGYFIFYHEISGKNKNPGYYFFRYHSKTSVKCNLIQEENILNDYSGINKTKIINKNIYGFLIFNKTDTKYLNQNFIVLKLKKGKDKLPIIIRSSAGAALNPENLINFIKKEFKSKWKLIKDQKNSYNNKFQLSVLIECLLRETESFIIGDLSWLFEY